MAINKDWDIISAFSLEIFMTRVKVGASGALVRRLEPRGVTHHIYPDIRSLEHLIPSNHSTVHVEKVLEDNVADSEKNLQNKELQFRQLRLKRLHFSTHIWRPDSPWLPGASKPLLCEVGEADAVTEIQLELDGPRRSHLLVIFQVGLS